MKAGELATAEGLSYLEAKHLLLLSYCIHIVFYVLLKAEGAPVRSHPVIGRLLQLRTYLVSAPTLSCRCDSPSTPDSYCLCCTKSLTAQVSTSPSVHWFAT